MGNYIHLLLALWLVVSVIYLVRYHNKLFNEDGGFSFKDFKTYNIKKKSFIYIVVLKIFTFIAVCIHIYVPSTKESKPIIETKKAEDYGSYDVIQEAEDEKTEAELEKEIRDEKTNYEIIRTNSPEADSIRRLEYQKALKDWEDSKEYDKKFKNKHE